MATRLYLHSGDVGTPPISPAYAAAWELTSSASRRFMSLQKPASSLSGSTAGVYTPAGNDALCRQFISHAPLAAQTISGNVKGQILGREDSGDANAMTAVVIKVVSSDGATVRGTLLSYFPGSLTDELAEYPAPLTNAYCPPSQALSSVVAQAGDRLVIEIGLRSFSAYYRWSRLAWYDSPDYSDLPEDNTTTGDYNAWIEFDTTIDFVDKVDIYSLALQTEYQETGAQRLAGLMAQAEYGETPQIRLAGCLIQVEYAVGTPFYRVLPVPPVKRFTQTQAFKRQVPQCSFLPD